MKRNFFAGDCDSYIYLINPAYVGFKNDDPRVRVFSSKKARDTYVKETPGSCALTARIARVWVDAYTVTHWYKYKYSVDDYLKMYPQNDLRSL